MITKRCLIALCATFLVVGCEADPNFWNAETCNTRLEADVADFEKYQVNFEKAKRQAQTDARMGNTVNAAANEKSAQSLVQNTVSLLTFVDSNIMPVCVGKFRQDLLVKLEAARKFAKEGGVVPAVEAEGMPDLRVTSVQSTFVPYELDERGACSGPYLNLVFTVSNRGGDYPRPVDLQTYTERTQRPADGLHFFTVIGELDFGGDMRKRLDLAVHGGSGGSIPSGGSLKIPAKVKVEYNQTHARVAGSVATTAFLKTAEGAAAYGAEIDVPLWDIYTFSHMVVQGKDENGKGYIATKATLTNNGASPTPGPIQGSFIINEAETGRYITGWTGKTDGPVSGNTDIYDRIPYDGKLPSSITVNSSIIPLCPDGNPGNLSDGDTTNNIRILRQNGAEGGGASSTGSL